MPPRSQAPLVARPTPSSQAVPPRPASPSTEDNFSAAAAAKKKKKKGKGKKADDELTDGNFHSPALSTAPFSATAKAQADLLATASDLYRRIEADPQGIPDDDAYWTSLPSHLRTFIRNALPIGHLPASAQNDVDDPNSRQASTQAMIAVAQQLAQAAHASQRQLQQHPPSGNATFQHGGNNVAYPPFPFDPSVFADLALQTEQALPLHPHPNSLPNGGGGYQYNNPSNPPPTQPPGEPLPAPVVLVNEFDDEQGEFDDDYYSDEEIDHHEAATIDSRDGGWTNEMNGTQANGLVTKSSAAKKKNKKKKKKGGTDSAAAPAPPPPAAPLNAPLAPPPTTNQTRTPAQQPPLRSPASQIPPPSSRAAGKQPMTFNTASGKAPVNTRSNVNGVGHNHNHGPISTAMGKRPASAAASSHGHGSVNGGAAAAGQSATRAWSSSSAEERERIKDFWLGLNERERKSLIKIEKDGVLKKMKEQQKHGCSCAVCGRKRSSIEDELEVLYDAYYDELEQYANHQQKHVESNGQVPPPPGPGPFPGSVALDSTGAVIGGNTLTKPPAAPVGNKRPIHQHTHPPPPLGRTKAALPTEDEDAYDEDLEDDEYEDDYEYEDEEEEEDELDEPDLKPGQRRRADAGLVRNAGNNAKAGANGIFNFGSSLTVKGGILTVADDLLKNDGQKFLEMMEQLAERRALREEEVQAELENVSEEEELEEDEEEEDEVELEEDALTDEQRMEEGRRMFQIFAARMFEQRVLQAYREKVAQERQLQLLRELEEEDMAEKEREAKKAKENQKKKDKKRQVKQQKEEERIKKEEEKAAEEMAARVKLEKQREAELRKQEEIRLKREAEKRQKDEEKAKKEEEKRKRQEEERVREAEKERKKKEKEDKIRLEREAKETKERELKEAKARQEEEERATREREKELEQEKLAKAEEARKEQQQERERQQSSPAVSVPTSPSASKSQAPPPNPLLKSPSSVVAMGASSPSPMGRKGDSSATQQAPSSPLQGRSSGGNNAAQKSQPRPTAATPPSVTSPSTLPAPPQGLPARPTTVSHTQQATLPSGPAGASSLPRPPMQSIGTLSPGGPLGSPARQGTPTISTTSPPAMGGLGKIVSPPLSSASSATQAAAPGTAFSKPPSNVMQQAQQHQPVQPIGRYPTMPFGGAHAGTPTRSPPLNNNGGGFMLANGGASSNSNNTKGSTFDSMLGSPTSVNATTAGLAAMSMAGLTPSGGAGSSSISQMPIGPIGGGMPLSSSSATAPTLPPHARTASVGGGMPLMDDYSRQGGSGPISRPAPGPIGPIGRRRDVSQDDNAPVGGSSIGGIGSGVGSGSTTSSIFGSSNAGPLPERVLGSSALGGDDELVEPQPRRTSHNTAPMANSSVFGGGAFGVSSPWGSSFAAGGSSNSGGGMPRTPATPASSMLHSALGTGLTGGSGSSSAANASAFGNMHQGSSGPPGVQVSLNSGVDPWARAANGWDRARFAFEQPNTQQQQSSAFPQQPPSQQQHLQQQQQQQLVSPGAVPSHPMSPFGGAGQSQHPSLRGLFGAPGTTTSPHRHSNDRGL